MVDLCCQTLLSVSEFCIISLVFGLKMPRGKKLCKSCSAFNSSASKKCTTCVIFDKRGIVVSIASFFYLGCGCLLEKKEDKILPNHTIMYTIVYGVCSLLYCRTCKANFF